ncbi:glutamyl-tRNA(Gln) amidotransferase subunit C [Microlunatus endophyticus]|uniref:Aspartyl/glutamyl-tRNA(Asn/Gln) amidotransferase subunit C n=1 Tax=Microlunatus endophyticus TaxID=1716077 RepID=A0A917S398_9ACTN|nr:glutamyl-tRNA(Gln) amidotransferase subunit C [Microlunatus endophyticus]
MDVALSREEVAALGRLARIELSTEELEHLAPQLDQILEHVARVSEVAAADIQPTSHPLPLSNVFRADEVRECLTAEQALSGAPAVEDGRFRVPRILGESA